MHHARTAVPIATKAKLYRGLSDPSRLAILEALREGRRTVGELVEATGLSQPNVSNHLSCLLDCGLVSREQRGRFAHYEIGDTRVEELLSIAETLLADAAQGIRCCTRYQGSEP